MEKVQYGGIEVDRCTGCKGLWFAMLEAEPFQLLICDLKMPKMDGLQVLAIVRRKYPQLRTVALTAEVEKLTAGISDPRQIVDMRAMIRNPASGS